MPLLAVTSAASSRAFALGSLCVLLALLTASAACARRLTLTELDTASGDRGPYATYWSSNQRVVSNQYGIFVAYVKDTFIANGVRRQTWRIKRSTDGGQTF